MSIIKNGEIHMKADEKRSHRLILLGKIYVKSGYSDLAVINRALLIGVTKVTAQSYLDTIKRRYKQ